MVTTPIYYVNDVPHLGHAYTTVSCDCLARFQRLDGRKVWFVTGTDEHGQKVEASSRLQGCASPQVFADRVSSRFRALFAALGSSHDDFVRTTEERHKAVATELWRRLEASGHIYEGSYAGWYSVRDEAYYAESELDGEGRAPTGAEVEWMEEPSYFFRLSAFEDRLLALYADRPEFVSPPGRFREVQAFIEQAEGGLKDLSISRTSFQWGVPVPSATRQGSSLSAGPAGLEEMTPRQQWQRGSSGLEDERGQWSMKKDAGDGGGNEDGEEDKARGHEGGQPGHDLASASSGHVAN